MASERVYAVRMGMTVAESEALSELLFRTPADVSDRVMDQLWLRTALIIARKQVPNVERPAFDARADRLLGLIDPPEESAHAR